MLGGTIHSAEDARRLAKRRLPWMVFDYIDGAAGAGSGEAANLAALRDIRLQPRVLVDVSRRDLGVSVLGQDFRLPFGISPMGMCNLARPGADLMLADINEEGAEKTALEIEALGRRAVAVRTSGLPRDGGPVSRLRLEFLTFLSVEKLHQLRDAQGVDAHPQ